MKQHAPATARNRGPICEVLARVLPRDGLVLEIASGSGEHAVYMAEQLAGLTWQPSDPSEVARASIAAWREAENLPNLRAPLALDAMADVWPITAADAIVCINMIHIAPWEATLRLFAGAARTLSPGGVLVTYGPYGHDGVLAPSNAEFDRSLRTRDARWGVRDVAELRTVAVTHGFRLDELLVMPANNHVLVFHRA
ncbi:MAG: DUF938 domain-containing protein [Deltaproteobacteria bacterium]|nr:DUF938 domain-containing protein [Deltaproteobacteria bacterium]